MQKLSNRYPEDIDEEIVPLLDALNSIPGVRTIASCCGHGDKCAYVAMQIDSRVTEHLLIERFSHQEGLVHFHFPDDITLGIYSDKVGHMPDMLRKAYFDYFIMQCDKIKIMLEC